MWQHLILAAENPNNDADDDDEEDVAQADVESDEQELGMLLATMYVKSTSSSLIQHV